MNKKIGLAVPVLIASVVICFIARLFQIVVGTDMTAGYLYSDNNFFINYGYYALIAVFFAAFVVTMVFDEKRGVGTADVQTFTDTKAAVIGFAMLLIGLCACYEGLEDINSLTPSTFTILTDFLFGAAIIAVAFVTLYKKEYSPGLGFSYCVGGVFCAARGVDFFTDKMAIVTIPEYLIEALGIIFSGVFFMLLSKLLSGNEQKLTRVSMFCAGGLSAITNVSSALATAAAYFFAPEEISSRITISPTAAEINYQTHMGIDAYLLSFTPWVNLAMGAAAIAIIIALSGRGEPFVFRSQKKETEES